MPWPYLKPVFVLSTTWKKIPEAFAKYATLIKGNLEDVLMQIHSLGHDKLYIDGGTTIQNFLKEDLIDEMMISTFPILLGGGAPLFGELNDQLTFKLRESKVFLNAITQDRYVRVG